MRKLKLQMHTTIDGYQAGPEGQLDWMTFTWDNPVLELVYEIADSSDTIIMGRKMTEGFVTYWEDVVSNKPDSHEFPLAQRMVNLNKIVFSKTQKTVAGKNVKVENGDLATAVNALKKEAGKDLLVYGGVNFVSSLLKNNLIDELYLFINPVAIGEGLSIFTTRQSLALIESQPYINGIVVNRYTPAKSNV